MKTISKFLISFWIILTLFPVQRLTGSSKCGLFVYTQEETPVFTDQLFLNTICSEQILGECWLLFEGNTFLAPQKKHLFFQEDTLRADISSVPIGKYTAQLMIYTENKTFRSNILPFSVESTLPTLTIKWEIPNTSRVVKEPHISFTCTSDQPLIEIQLQVNQETFSFPLIEEKEWKFDAELPLKDGVNSILVTAKNKHHAISQQTFEVDFQKPRFAKQLPVLAYHEIGKQDDEWTITPQAFEKQLQFLVENDFHFCTPEEALWFCKGKISLPQKSILLTFDDGYKGVFSNAFPLLKKYRAKATVFLVNSFLDSPEYLSWKELDIMNDSEIFTFGSHSYALHSWINYSMIPGGGFVPKLFHLQEENWDNYLIRVRSDLKNSRNELYQRYGKPIYFFAYPFGAYNSETIKRVNECGFLGAFTYNHGTEFISPQSNSFTMNRLPVQKGTSLRQLLASTLP